jgi:hypothetical protein
MTDLDKMINQRLQEKHREAIDMALLWDHDHDVAMPALEKIAALGFEPYVLSTTHIVANVNGDIDTLTAVIRALRTAGYSSPSKPERKNPSFTAFYKHPDAKLEIFLQFSSSVCKRVKVGETTQVVPVYEIQCGESTEFAAEGA